MKITAEIIAEFRESKPRFSDVTKWPDSVVSDALCEADASTGGRWGGYDDECSNFKRRGMFFFASHYLQVYYQTGNASDPGSSSGSVKRLVASKSVGDESTSYEASSGGGGGGGGGDDWFKTTNDGMNYLRLRRIAGMGAMAL